MRSRTFLATMTMAALLLLSVGTAQAATMLHNFDCAECHKSGVTWTSVDSGNICLQCHGSSPDTNRNLSDIYDFGDPADWTDDVFGPDADSPVSLSSGFQVGDASNKLGSNASAGNETSHNWGARIYNPRAGAASNPTDPMYNPTTASRNASGGYVTCFRCHDPHGVKQIPKLGTNKLLRTPGYTDQDATTMVPTPENVEATCVVCHADWAAVTQAENGLESHPLVTDYPTFQAANSGRFKPWSPNGEMQLINGGVQVGCTTCHGLHNTDSDASTTDGPGVTNGDGALLRGDGLSVNQSNLCQSCHRHQNHPSSGGEAIGCLVCHSGHSYNDGTPNYYVLRSDVDTSTFGARSGLRYDDLAKPINELYAGLNGDDGYCTGCHGDITGTGPGQPSENQAHTGAEDCSQCHNHFDPANPTDPSFVGKGCNGCHGYPPRQNVAGGDPNAGYASDLGGTGHDYNSNNGTATFRDESATPHATHAFNNPVAANINCKTCHNAHLDDFTGQHNNATTGPTFQNVLEGAYTMPVIASGNGALSPAYAGGNTCNNVYCHSNGNQAALSATSVTWANQNGAISDCAACHGDDSTTMSGKGNTSAHGAHLDRGYACNVCHNQTAIDGSTVDVAAGTHIDLSVDLDLDDTFELSVGNAVGSGSLSAASCSVYCHSDGAGTQSSPSWSGAANCGSCHSVNGATLPDSHARHLSDADGPQINACDVCHTHNGEMTPGNDHVDGVLGNVDYTNCRGCHGTNGGSGVDADLTKTEWTNGTASCESCHIGALSTLPAADTKYSTDVTAPAKDTFATTGHGSVATPPACTDCHDAADTGHFDLTSGDDQRLQDLGGTPYAGNETAWCQDCHTTVNAHYLNSQTPGATSTDADNCIICHEPHGEGMGTNTDAMLTVGTGFTDKAQRSSYWNASNSGVCQICHDQAEVLYFNRTTESDATHNAGQVCTDCHSHDSNPAFQGSATSCGGCHNDEMAANGHPAHVQKKGGIIEDDLSDCIVCHGAAVASYTLTGGHANHQNGSPDFAAGIGIGGTGPDFTCSGACHSTAAGQSAVWTATALTCDSCHGNPPADGGGDGSAHGDHVTAGYNCDTCHVIVPSAGDTSHITDVNLAGDSEDAILADMGDAQADEANVSVTTWDDINNTCANTACHNPSGTSYIADWDASTSSCALCHADTTGDPGTGSHSAHRTTPENYSADIACVECHVDNGADTAHRDGTVDVPLDGTIATSGTATPAGTTWNGTTCSATYCHNGSLIGGASGFSDPGSSVSPAWGSNLLVGTTADCAQCHDYPPNPAQGHPNNNNCNACHTNTVAGTNDGFTDPSLHVEGVLQVEGGDTCTDCHNGADIDGVLNGVHSSHTDVATFLAGKSISGGDYGGAGWYGTSYVAGQPMFACGQCHPANETATHPTNGLNLDIDPAGETPGVGNIKTKNGAQNTPTYISRSSVTCASVYCHSNAVGTFRTTPDWYGGSISANCNDCHGNWPATNAHQVHQVGIHFDDIYDANNSSGLMPVGDGTVNGGDTGHGTNEATTINCNICHNATVNVAYNDRGDVTLPGINGCADCHDGFTATLRGNMTINAAGTTHVNGQADIVFADINVRSKAQVRNDITTVTEIDSNWTRTTYKNGAGSFDTSTDTLLNAASYSAGTCSAVFCHNGRDVSWGAPSGNCMVCHTELPQ